MKGKVKKFFVVVGVLVTIYYFIAFITMIICYIVNGNLIT